MNETHAIDTLVVLAISPTCETRTNALNAIKELRLDDSPGADKMRDMLRSALEKHLSDDPWTASYAAEALGELGDPKALKAINNTHERISRQDADPEVLDTFCRAVEALTDAKKLKGKTPGERAADAMEKLDQAQNARPMSDKAAAKAAENVVKDLFKPEIPKKPTKLR